MLGSEVLFDTNALIAWIKNDDALFKSLSGKTTVAISLVSLGELYYGTGKSRHRTHNRQVLDRAVEMMQVIEPDRGTAEFYGEVCLRLGAKGRPIPTNDVWIAATALQYDLPLVTRDAHFREIEDIKINSW